MKIIYAVISLTACCADVNKYNNYYYSFTNYNLEDYIKKTTPDGITIYANESFDAGQIDTAVYELEQCLEVNIERSWFVVLIPDDYFYSDCSGEQLLPYSAPAEFCRSKGLDITPNCEGVPYAYRTPTQECPCTCNWRVATQEDYIIVTVPSLVLLKAELARMVTGINNPWELNSIRECL